MQDWEKPIILKAFLKCFGLRSALLKENDNLLRKASIHSLAKQTGFRESYLEDNLKEILELR